MKKSILTLFLLAAYAVGVMADCPPSSVTATVTLQFTGNGMLDGEFTVSTDKKVNFSKGNLQYQASTNTWRFAENQWTYIGNNNANVSSSYTGWIDLFGWATSGSQASNVVGYQPYYTVKTQADYGPAISSGEWTKENSDWGTVNADQLGLGWHVLSQAEWSYLISTRTNAANLRTLATVHGVNGLIILPDTWTQANSHMSGTLPLGTGWHTVTDANWTILENEGAVFLPAAGIREGVSVAYGNTEGYYWSSSVSSSTQGYRLNFTSTSCSAGGSDNRYYGFSVRLVKSLH